MLTDTAAIAATQDWLERAVIGLGLCPFAKAVHVRKQIRYVVTPAESYQELLEALAVELRLLDDSDPERIDTTLLIHPNILEDFLDYNWFIELADDVLEQLDLVGTLQIAHFHPAFQFEGTVSDDPGNFSNRSPYPMLHLLREDSVERAVAAFPDAASIYEKNIATLRTLGHEGWIEMWRGKT